MRNKKPSPDKFIQALCAEIRDRREELGISQEELALQADLHRTYVSLIERKGVNFTMQIFFRIAEALDISPFTLIAASQKSLAGKGNKPTRNTSRSA